MPKAASADPADILFLKTINKYRLVKKGSKVLVGFSGGTDSVCLLDLFQFHSRELGITVAACHVNHGLRGRESDRDETFARRFCAGRDIEFHSVKLDVKKYAKKNKLSLETAARECRYRVFRETAEKAGASLIATAHHQGDLAETLLYRIFRGTGISGLVSIPVKRDNIIRPLLHIPAEWVRARVKRRKLPHVEDRSNKDTDFDRNYIRKKIVPVVSKRFPAFAEKAAGLAEIAAEEERYWEEKLRELDRYVKITENGSELDKKIFRDRVPEALLRRKVRELLRDCGDTADVRVGTGLIERVIGAGQAGEGNKTVFRAKGIRILSSYNNICFLQETKKFHKQAKHVTLKDRVKVECDGYSLSFSGPVSGNDRRGKDRMVFASGGMDGVTVRCRRDGDRIRLEGGGTKKVKDYLIDLKVPLAVRERVSVIESPGGKVIAVFVPEHGFRVSGDFYVREGSGRVTSVTAGPGGN